MTVAMDLHGKTALVLGMGETGLSMARWLMRVGACVRAADSREAPPCLDTFRKIVLPHCLFTGPFSAEAFAGIDLVAISPGVPLGECRVQQAIKDGIPVIGDMQLFAEAIRQPGTDAGTWPIVVAITGSNGKTTVTAMVGEMMKQAGLDVEVAGNIGPAVLDALLRRVDSGTLPQAWVLEISSFQLETSSSLPVHAATVLNISEDHLDRYAGMGDYAAAKARIFLNDGTEGDCSRSGWQILNRDDSLVRGMALPGRRQITFGLSPPTRDTDFCLVREDESIWLAEGSNRLMNANGLGVTGLHNAANALAALALCRAVGLPYEPLLRALREFRGLAHRMEKVATVCGVVFYDDSKGTNVGATVAALKGMGQNVVLIAGGDGKGQDFSPLAKPVAEHARAVVLIGRDAERIASAIQCCGVSLHRAVTMEEAVQQSFRLARKGDAVLLSPACASLDMFRNYAHRAEVFVKAVEKLEAFGIQGRILSQFRRLADADVSA